MTRQEGQKGQALTLALIFLAVGALMIVPVLNYTTTGLHSQRISEEYLSDQNAADAAVMDAIWQILKQGALTQIDPETGQYVYDFELTLSKWRVTIEIPSVSGGEWQQIRPSMFCKIDVVPNWLEALGEKTFHYIFRLDMPSWEMEDFSFVLPQGIEYESGSPVHVGPEKQNEVDPDADVEAENFNLHYDGSTWTSISSGTTEYLCGVWGSSPSDVFAVGDSGTILHCDGSTWSSMSSGTTSDLRGVWGSSSSNVYAVGVSGIILHYDGSTWSSMSSGTTEYLRGVWGSSPSDVFAVGDSGTILHCDGSTWTSISSGTTEYLCGVWGSSSSNVYAVGDSGTILHCDGSTWSSMSSGTTEQLRGVWGGSPSDVFAVGDSGTILHCDGDSWSPMSSGTTSDLRGVWGSSSSNVYAVGVSGTILHYDGSWNSMSSGITEQLRGVWGSSSSDVFAVGHSRIKYYRQAKPSGWDDMTAGNWVEVTEMPSSPDPNTWYLVITEVTVEGQNRQMLTWRPAFEAFTGKRTYIMVFEATGTLSWGFHYLIPQFGDGVEVYQLEATAAIASAMYNIIIQSGGQTILAVISLTAEGEIKLISYQVLR